jgi:hypothetical protein
MNALGANFIFAIFTILSRKTRAMPNSFGKACNEFHVSRREKAGTGFSA